MKPTVYENMVAREQQRRILRKHGIDCFILRGRTWALDSFTQYNCFFQEWIEITPWSKDKIYAWLGY